MTRDERTGEHEDDNKRVHQALAQAHGGRVQGRRGLIVDLINGEVPVPDIYRGY